MNEVKRADPTAHRRPAVLWMVVCAAAGAAAILAVERYRPAFQAWVLSEPEKTSDRINLVLGLAAFLLSTPLLGLGVYLWILGGRAGRGQQLPPAGPPVICDPPDLRARAAITRGRILKAVAVCAIAAGSLLIAMFWRLSDLFGRQAP